MSKLYNGSIGFSVGINQKGAVPLDDRSVVKSFNDLLSADTFGLSAYEGMMVAVVDEKKVFMLVDKSNSTTKDAWVAVGSGNGSISVETYADAVAIATSENIGQVIYVKTKSSYDADGEGEGVAVEYDAAPYIVIGDGALMKLAASSASGDIESDVAELLTKVSNLETSLGDAESGLIKEVEDLKLAVDAIEIPEVPVQDVKVNGESVIDENGVAVIELPNFDNFATTGVVSELDSRVNSIADDVEGHKQTISNLDTQVKENKSKLDTISENAQVNVIEVVKVNGEALIVSEADKSVDITVPKAPVQGVADGDKIISLDGDKLKSTLILSYVAATENETAQLRLQGINGEVVSSIDATAFVKDGILSGAKLEGPAEGESGEKYLVLSFNTEAGKEDIRLDVSELLDYYVAGDGLNLDGNVFSIKVDETSNDYLQVTTAGISVSQSLLNKITTSSNNALNAAKTYADEQVSASTSEITLYVNGIKEEINGRVDELESKHNDFALAENVYSKETADSTFVKVESFNEVAEKVEGIEEGAQVNKIESVSVNGIDASIEGKSASVKIEANDIELGTEIKNGEDVKYEAATKLSVVLQGIQDSIRGAIAGGVNSVSAGDTAIVVNSADANNPVVSLKVEESTEETVAGGHIELVKGNNGVYGVMYYDGNDME